METLTNRERFRRTMQYEAVDRVPHYEMGIWGQTLDRWQKEGMPSVENEENLIGAMGLLSGSEYYGLDRREYVDIGLRTEPPFPERTIEETERYRIWIDSEGSTRKALREGEAHGVRMSMDTLWWTPMETRAS